MRRHEILNETLKSENLDAILISNLSNIFYFSNFTGTNATLLICEDEKYLITDFRYEQQAKISSPDFTILLTDDDNSLEVLVNKIKKKKKIQTIALEGDYISRNSWLHYEKTLTARLSSINIDHLRSVKTESEVELIKKSISIAEKAFELTLEKVQEGVSEKYLARYLEYKMFELGAESIAFNTIVASGIRGALPHGVASDKLIQNNELITFDWGCKYKGYCSDITRTVALGNVDEKLMDIYNTVHEANQLGIETVKAGMLGQEVDDVVRTFIYDKGYKGKFGHGLGHSFGVDIHEDPRLRSDDFSRLEVGNIVTIEPGIYVEGLGGVRIEDDILLTEDGYEVLTTLSKELIIL